MDASLVGKFLDQEGYNQEFSDSLISVARGQTGASWEVRCLAILMLENLALRLALEESPESVRLLALLGARETWLELRSRLSRLDRVHRGIRGQRTSAKALADFFHVCGQECKLTLARYLLAPDDVARRIVSRLRYSAGLPYWVMRGEIEPRIGSYEKQIIEKLRFDGQIYWTADQTPSAINSLVEYPQGTVVLVLKLPGSDLELELKRGGVRGPQPLGVRHFRAAHRLFGGSAGTSNDAEARAAMRLAELYRGVHGEDPPISSTVAMSYVQTVPGWRREEHLLTYLTDSEAFGKGYREMRAAMKAAVDCFEDGSPNLELPGELGLTVRFLRYMPPRQALLKGSTSYRLDLLDDYLSADGPRLYFTEGLGVSYRIEDARRFAADLLEEVLGVFEPPSEPGESYEDYVRNSLNVPANRERADCFYLQHLRQVGLLWGTLAAAGGHSHGESFVTRNVGLKSRWKDGCWTTQIVFMDHDTLRIPGGVRPFDPGKALPGMRLDEGYCFEDEPRGEQSRGAEGCLRRIYRVSQELRSKAAPLFQATAAEGFRKTRWSMNHDRAVRGLFGGTYIERMEVWDALVWSRIEAERDEMPVAKWHQVAEALLARKGLGPRMTGDWIAAADQNLPFLTRYSYFFDPKYRDLSFSNRQSG